MVYAGMGPDYRVLVTEARKAASVYSAKYGEPIPTEQLVMSLATVMQVNTVTHFTLKLIRNLFFVASIVFQSYTQMGGVRPFGCSLLVIGMDDLAGPMLYQCDPSGCYFPWKATALGNDHIKSENPKNFLRKKLSQCPFILGKTI